MPTFEPEETMMKTLMAGLTISAALTLSANAGTLHPVTAAPLSTSGNPRAVAAIVDAHERFFTAYLNADPVLTEQILAKGFRFIAGDGRAIERQAYIPLFLEEVRARQVSDLRIDGVFVQVFGRSGVVSGHLSSEVTRDGKRVRTGGRFVDIYVKEGGAWRVAYSSFFRDAG